MRYFICPEQIFIGKCVSIGKESYLYASENSRIIIEDGVILARRVVLRTTDHRYDGEELGSIPFDEVNYVEDIKIGNGTWIGEDCVVMPGVNIGRGCVVGTHSVVTHDLPDYSIAVGSPARVIKYRNKEVFERLLKDEKFYLINTKKKEYRMRAEDKIILREKSSEE